MRPNHYWTTAEDRELKQFYPALGPKGTAERLPGRSYGAINTRASNLKLRFLGSRGPHKKRKWELTEALERELRKVYRRKPVRGAVKRLAEEHGVPNWWLKRQASKLGIAKPQKRGPDWTDAEDDMVRRWHGHALETIQRKLKAAGSDRTTLAISVHLKLLSLSNRPDNYYTGVGVAKMLGVNEKTPTLWVSNGWLTAKRRGTARTDHQGGDMYWIHRDALRQFVIDYWHLIDLRKIEDTEWFIHLLAGKAGDGRQHKRKHPGRGNGKDTMDMRGPGGSGGSLPASAGGSAPPPRSTHTEDRTAE